MNIQLNIEYHTEYGDELLVAITTDGKLCESQLLKMMTTDGSHWKVQLSVPADTGFMDYSYRVMRNGADLRQEWTVVPHRLEFINDSASRYVVNDRWIDNPEDSYLYSSAFTECIAERKRDMSKVTGYHHTLRLKVRAPQLGAHARLAIVGHEKTLGEWNVMKSLTMAEHNYNEWVATIDEDQLTRSQIEFKFVILHDALDVDELWEEGANRVVDIPEKTDDEVDVIELAPAKFSIYPWRGAGTVIPVFSLRSTTSFGVGDFGDLKKMVDWMAQTRQRVLQVLPINDTTISHTWTDSYPYNSISIYALHPQYVNLNALPSLKDEARKSAFEVLRQELNALPQIDYERVNNAKMDYLKAVFMQEGHAMMKDESYKKFFDDNQQWLVPYAAFCHYRDKYQTAAYREWPDHHAFEESERKSLTSPSGKLFKEVAIYYFIQYILDSQLREAHAYAREKGIVLKGDIPIGISRDSVEAWMEPYYFNFDGQAGAPPDDFSVNGQNWGFPTYNWEAMLGDHCKWWVNRFRKMSQYFDAYRIDHILGFFRIWEIPANAVHGLLGQFSPALPMTAAEIQSYNLTFRETLFTEPYITDDVVSKVFGIRQNEVKETYLDPTTPGRYKMKSAYDTQRKVEASFQDKTTADDIAVRDGLYTLISEVLFLRDRRHPETFHPRIGVQLDYIYDILNDEEKYNFNKLYNDYFYHRHNSFWYHEAMKKLPLLTQSTRMLVCGEDLGMVPECVAWVMNELRILSLEIQSMPKEANREFGPLSHNPYRSVCTISTHDMPTLRGWWEEDHQRAQRYYATMLRRSGDAPGKLPGWLAGDIISRHLTSKSMLCLLSLQDWMAMDEDLRLDDAAQERINVPANPRNYWRYRMHVTIEKLMASAEFNDRIVTLIQQSGRK